MSGPPNGMPLADLPSNDTPFTGVDQVRAPVGWRWAPAWVLAFVALWPAPGYAEAVMVLGALAAIVRLMIVRFRGGTRLLSAPAWALTSVLFFAYWLPEVVSVFDAIDYSHALHETLTDLRYLPFLWLAAAAVSDARGRRTTFAGLAIIMAAWTLDALLQAVTGTSALFWGVDSIKHLISGHGMCPASRAAAVDRLSGVLGPCNLKLGLVLASLSPFVLYAARKQVETIRSKSTPQGSVRLGSGRLGSVGWLIAAAAMGIVILLAGARAAWITYALVLLCSGWRVLGAKRLIGVFAFGALMLGVLTLTVPQVRERIVRTTSALTADQQGVDIALSGRTRIWRAAACMVREHPINGVGAGEFRLAFPACDPQPNVVAVWGAGPALHAHQIVLEILSETGGIGLLFWLAGAALAWRAWRFATDEARDRARPAMLALAVTVFPFNTHLAFYSTFWGGVTLLLAALYAGSLLGREAGSTPSE
jgi:O-antigen ligase